MCVSVGGLVEMDPLHQMNNRLVVRRRKHTATRDEKKKQHDERHEK